LFQADQKPAVEHATFHVATRRTGKKTGGNSFYSLKHFRSLEIPFRSWQHLAQRRPMVRRTLNTFGL
jgi:hypothetical protein